MNETKDFETMSRLKFIGRIKKGERIDVGNLTLMRPSIFTSLYRTFINRDNRTNSLHFIRETVSSAFDMAEYLEANMDSCEANKQMLRNLLADIRGALLGIQSVKCTYSGDTKFCCDIEIIEQLINAKFSRLTNFDNNY